MNELQASIEGFAAWKAILWCFYPMTVLVALELLVRTFNDDDDQDGGKAIPILQANQS